MSGWSNPGNDLKLVFELVDGEDLEGQKARGVLPRPGNNLAAGIDIISPSHALIPPRGKVLINCLVKAKPPAGYHLEIQSRSGSAAKASIEKGAGIIDRDYNDPIRVLLYNHSDKPYQILKGDKIAQVLVRQTNFMNIVEASTEDGLDRGGGFGSTGR